MWIGQELLALRNKTEISADLHSQLAALLQTLQPLGSAYATIETLWKEDNMQISDVQMACINGRLRSK
jgi:hypothetical protein